MLVTELMKGGRAARLRVANCRNCCAVRRQACAAAAPSLTLHNPMLTTRVVPPASLFPGGDLYTALRRHPDAMRWERLGRKVALDVALG